MDKENCELNVLQALQSSERINKLLKALKSSGCPVVPSRHIACIPCDGNQSSLLGGYDLEHNQVVICQNKCKNPKQVEEILSHELVHLYDFCTAKLDFSNVEHLACTEIRASSLVSCSSEFKNFFQHWSHAECVKSKASKSVSVIKNLNSNDSREAVSRVFEKCYADLEPLGSKCSGTTFYNSRNRMK